MKKRFVVLSAVSGVVTAVLDHLEQVHAFLEEHEHLGDIWADRTKPEHQDLLAKALFPADIANPMLTEEMGEVQAMQWMATQYWFAISQVAYKDDHNEPTCEEEYVLLRYLDSRGLKRMSLGVDLEDAVNNRVTQLVPNGYLPNLIDHSVLLKAQLLETREED